MNFQHLKKEENHYPKIVVVYYSRSGHTKILAKIICEGMASINPNVRLINIDEISESDWNTLKTASGIILGSPTYMGGVAGEFKVFLDESSRRGFWINQLFADKMAAGFTIATYPSGDKLNTLMQLAIFAAQHGMVWVNNAGLGNKVSPKTDKVNTCGSWLGLMATSTTDKRKLINETDAITAFQFGVRFAQSVNRWEQKES